MGAGVLDEYRIHPAPVGIEVCGRTRREVRGVGHLFDGVQERVAILVDAEQYHLAAVTSQTLPRRVWAFRRGRGFVVFDQVRRERTDRLFERRQVSLGEALTRLGDDFLVEQTVRSLTDAHGNFNTTAYTILHDMIGPPSQGRLTAYLEAVDPETVSVSAFMPIYWQDEMDPERALSLCTENPDFIRPEWVAPVFVAHRYAPAGDYLVAAFEKAKKGRAARRLESRATSSLTSPAAVTRHPKVNRVATRPICSTPARRPI